MRSDWRLPYPREPQAASVDVALVRRPSAYFTAARAEAGTMPQPWLPEIEATLADGSTYFRWPRQFEFLVSADGRTIAARPLAPGSPEGFHTYLLGQALSIALIRQGLDPLHATVVTVAGAGAAFLGDSGYGKSSLAAAFIGAGHRLLTDDLLILTEGASGFAAHPGPPRLKLYPRAARTLLPQARGTPIMPTTPKLLVPLARRHVTRSAAQLQAIYVLMPPTPHRMVTRVTIRRLWQTQACLALIRNTFNPLVTDAGRLTRQFVQATRVAGRVPVKLISYPRTFGSLPAVRDAIIADLERESR